MCAQAHLNALEGVYSILIIADFKHTFTLELAFVVVIFIDKIEFPW